MVQHTPSDEPLPPRVAERRQRLFRAVEPPAVRFPIQSVQIDWERLEAKRPVLLDTLDAMPAYLLKPEVLRLLAAEKHPRDRLILDLMWTTGARVSEVLALTPSSFKDDGFDYGVVLKTLKQRPGRPSGPCNAPPSAMSPSLTWGCSLGSRAICIWGNFGRGSGSSRSVGRRSTGTFIN
ncbi:hypothetical protein [Gilvimarinus algae]|uniref:Tyr recombinase domain-containing protein n=1 Tax=Gilvimarinus algae TaxID=3058037 RepID=A0ABT8TJ83_9GAMM|nr:hypothetical protein [Gilvimarinus sp. SDUM040014]MDO3382392.1 hypothetical protein [Gilvimarinus sp. SDUM040014]